VGVKTGALRSQQRERFWRKLIAGQRRSGRSVLAWCGEQGVSVPSFYAWRQRLVQRDAERRLGRSSLLPVEIISSVAGESGSALEIEWPGGMKVRVRPGCELEILRQVLTMLRQTEQEAERC